MYVYFPCFFRGDLERAFNLLTSTLFFFLFSIIPISFNFVIGFFLLILANVWGGFMHTFH